MIRQTLVLSASLALAACATPALVPEAPGPADVPLPPAYAAGYRPPAGTGEVWWQGFDDPALNALVAEALDDNLDVAATLARLEAARAVLRAERSDRLPLVDAGASAFLDLSASGLGDAIGVGATALFNPDISGRLSAEIRAAAAQYAVSDYLVADTRRLVAAEVAYEYIDLRRSGARLALLEQSTELQEQTLRIVTLRFEAGLSANLDVRRAAADLAQTRAQRGLLELERARSANALAVLTADLPGVLPGILPQLALSEAGIPSYAGGPPRGIPADLLRRRPDILVAEARLVEAAALIGVERADLLPQLIIPGEIGIGSGSLTGLLSDFLIGVGASLNLPLFDGGRRRAEIAASEAEAEARFAEYRQEALLALAEVENALVAIQAYSDRNADLAQAIEESETAFEQSNALYREGLASLFDVLDAQRQLISSRQALIDSEAALASSVVALYAAIGAPPSAVS